jgi:tetratricopeptide (TPR) repeat protein
MNGLARMRSALALVVLMSSLAPAFSRAETLNDVFAEANRACARRDFAAAIAGYEQLREAGVDDPDLSYNLGTAHAKAGHYGQAIRHFEHALTLAPGDPAVRKHLEQARQALGHKLASKTGEATVATRPPLTEAMFSTFSADTLALSLLSATWLLTLCLFALGRTRTEALRLGLGICAAVSVAVAAIASFGLGVKSDWGAPGRRAIVIHDDVPLREGPDQAAASSLRLREGTQVRSLGRERDFVEIELSGDRRGYLPASDVGEI